MLWTFEMTKVVRSRRLVVAGGTILLFLVLMLLGFYTYAETETGGQVDFRYTYENESYFNGLTFALYAFYFAILMIVPIFAAAEGGSQIAGEAHGRTLQLLLSRPVSRNRIFLVKLVTSIVYLIVLVGLLLLLALLVGLFSVGWGELNLYPGVLQMTSVPQHLTQSQALRAFLCAWPLGVIAMLAVWMKNPINTVAASVAIYLVLYVVSQVHFFHDLQPFLFTSYVGYWRGVFQEAIDWSSLLQDAAKLMAFACLFLAIGVYRFRISQDQ